MPMYTLLTLLHAMYFFHFFMLFADNISKLTFSKKKKNRNMIRVSNGFNPDQDHQNVGPDLGPNCLQSLSAADKSRH